MRAQFFVSVLIGLGLFLAGLYASHAATVTWNGSFSALWEDSANWTGGKPTDADTAAFPTTIPGTGATITLADDSQTYHLSFNNSYTLTGGKLNFPLIPSEGSNPPSVVVTVGTGCTVTLETQLARVRAGGSVTSGMSKSGAGTLILTGDNSSLAGNWLDVTGVGVLNLQHNKAMGAIPYAHVYPGASLQVQNDITVANGVYIRGDGVGGNGALRSVSGDNTWAGYVRVHSSSLSGSIGVDAGSTLTVTGRVEVYNNHPGELHKSGDGVLVFEGDNTYTGPTFVNAGALNIRHNNALGTTAGATTVHAGAALQVQNSIIVTEALVLNGNGIGNSGALRSISGNNVWNGNIEHDNAWIGVDVGSTLTVNGQISGSGELRKVGSGVLVLAGENTYDGDTRITAGTIRLSGGANRINPDGSLYMTSNTVLDLNGNNQTFAKVDSSAARIDTGGGMLTVNAHSTYSDIRNRTASPTTVLTGSGGLTKLGSATLYMGGPSDYTGGTFINAGTMALYSKNDCLPVTGDVFVASGATLNLRLYDYDNDQQIIDELSGVGTVQLNGALFILGNGNSSDGANDFAGQITNGSRTGGGLTKVGSGTQIFSGNSDYMLRLRLFETAILALCETSRGGRTSVSARGRWEH
ncbi:MAG: autotransporter-associated beta strand repeat-containing protein, partial [Thermoguttaceae bacterium]|nr:autotransporter-associated beta strand repeat-containing protein [Thermoguttaceae bacterium]